MAVLLVLGPIFEEDLFPWQYGFRDGLDATMALRRIYFGIAKRGAREVESANWRASTCPIPPPGPGDRSIPSADTGLNDRGRFSAPAGTPYGARSLPFDEARMQYTRYRVLKPLEAQGGPAAPAFGEPGGGLQYLTPRSTADMIRQGYLEPLPP